MSTCSGKSKLEFRGIRSKVSEADTDSELLEMEAVDSNSDVPNNSESLIKPIVGKTSIFNRSTDENNKGASKKPVCTGSEDLRYTDSSYTDVSQVRISYNVYKAVYAIAHALHTLLNCDSAEYNNGMCDRHKTFTSRHVSLKLPNICRHQILNMFLCFHINLWPAGLVPALCSLFLLSYSCCIT